MPRAAPSGRALDPLPRMEVGVDPLRHLLADARRLLQVAQAGHLHAARGTEMVQQRPLAGGADALDLVKLAGAQRLRSASAVGGDGEAVRLVAQALQEIQHRVAGRELESLPSLRVEPLAAGVAVGTLGNADQL